jgi:cytochrome c oxidase subunit 3
MLALIFTGLQGVEYSVSSFTISDGAFGSCFYLSTGFHGLTSKPAVNLTNKNIIKKRICN